MKKILLLTLFLMLLCYPSVFSQEQGGVQRQQFNINFTGKWDPTHDPIILAPGNFADIQNLRYRDQGLKGMSGATKINIVPLVAYPKIRNGFHFAKDQPAESHVFVQAYNSGETASQIFDNTTAIPNTGSFSLTALHTDATGAGIGIFSPAPDGNVVYCNGAEATIWGGDEMRVGAFLNYNPDGSFLYDYTKQVSNPLTDSKNIATIKTVSGAGIDSDVMLLLHLDNNVTDSSPTTVHTVTDVGGNLTYSTSDKTMGTHAAVLDGSSAYMTIPDDADFDLSDGTFALDMWMKIDDLANEQPLYYQEGTNNSDYSRLSVQTTGSVKFKVNTLATGADVEVETDTGLISASTWYHIELTENGNNWYLFINGIQRAYLSDADRVMDYTTSPVQIGYDDMSYFDGRIDEFRVSDVARHTEDFDVPAGPYSTSTTEAYFYLGSTRPLQGFKVYIATANTSTSSMTVQEWLGNSWSTVSNLSDGTSSGGKSLTAIGSVSFDSTVSTSIVKYINGTSLYYYRIHISAVASDKTISYVTVDAPWQDITNVWSGDYGFVAACLVYNNSKYEDYTLEVNDESTATFMVLDSLSSSEYLLLGFQNPSQGFEIDFIDTKVNTNTATLSLYYWGGAAWVLIEAYEDGTLETPNSMNKSGTISFSPIAQNTEFSQTINALGPYYFYKLQWSAALDGEVEAYLISGIEAPDELLPYEIGVNYQNRVLLCSKSGDSAEVRISEEGAPNVFNGSDSTTLTLGGDDKFVAGTALFNRLGSSIYNWGVLCKESETWLLSGYAVEGDGAFITLQVSDIKGCIAPKTMTSCEVIPSTTTGGDINAIFWLGYGGPLMCDGTTVKTVKGVEPYFDENDSRCINYAYADRSVGFFDAANQEYNLLIPSGSGQIILNEWLIYDLIRDKWTKKDTDTYHPQSGFTVRSTAGQQYNYLGLDIGFILRNEYGNDFFDQPIQYSITLSDILPTGSLWEEVRVDFMKFICESKGDSNDEIAVYYRGDSDTSWTTMTPIPIYTANRRLTHHTQRINKIAIGHQFRFDIETDDVTDGFEPLSMSLLYHVERMDVKLGARN